MDGLRTGLLVALGVLEAGLDRVDAARSRVELRRFLRDNPGVTIHPWNDGTD